MSDSVIDDVINDVIKELQARIVKLEDANESIKEKNTELSKQLEEMRRGYTHYKIEYDKLKNADINTVALIERYERVIDHFLDNS
jgi:chromosome segregation ATPase